MRARGPPQGDMQGMLVYRLKRVHCASPWPLCVRCGMAHLIFDPPADIADAGDRFKTMSITAGDACVIPWAKKVGS